MMHKAQRTLRDVNLIYIHRNNYPNYPYSLLVGDGRTTAPYVQ